ncbi:MAG: hypothetical protein ACLUQ6_13435 [Alistipes onderdonkii]
MRQLVETASAYGQNVWLLYETGTPVPTADGKGLTFDFSRMDKTIEFLLRHADVRLIEANHFAKRSRNGWIDPFWANVPIPTARAPMFINVCPMTTRACNDTSQRIFRLCRSICVPE